MSLVFLLKSIDFDLQHRQSQPNRLTRASHTRHRRRGDRFVARHGHTREMSKASRSAMGGRRRSQRRRDLLAVHREAKAIYKRGNSQSSILNNGLNARSTSGRQSGID